MNLSGTESGSLEVGESLLTSGEITSVVFTVFARSQCNRSKAWGRMILKNDAVLSA